jgi:hypothetical protein
MPRNRTAQASMVQEQEKYREGTLPTSGHMGSHHPDKGVALMLSVRGVEGGILKESSF